MKRHLMRSPDDLDLFAPDQAELTGILDGHGGSTAVEGICQNASAAAVSAMGVLCGAIPLDVWQRAVYEMHHDSRYNQKGSEGFTHMARIAWMALEFIQANMRYREEVLNDPAIREKLKGSGTVFEEIVRDFDRHKDD